MLNLTRRIGEKVHIKIPPFTTTQIIQVEILDTKYRLVNLGFDAHQDIQIDREEIAILKAVREKEKSLKDELC